MSRLSRLTACGCAALCVAGLAIAAYLTTVHYAEQPVVCGGLGDCEYVNGSRYASIHSLPVAALGVAAYGAMLALLLAALLRGWTTAALAAWAISLTAVVFSGYLTYIEIHTLRAICVYCVTSAAIVTAIFLALTPSALAWLVDDGEPAARRHAAPRAR